MLKVREMSETTAASRRWKRNLALLIIPALISAAAVFLFWQSHPDVEYWIGLIAQGREFLEANPWALIAALAILPGLGFPISPLLILFGIVLTPRYGVAPALAIAIAAQGLCTVWTYALAAGPLRGLLTRYMLRHRELPELSEQNALRLGLIIRLTPGIPYAIQNIVLGILGMRLPLYVLISIPTTSIWTVGFVVTGGAIFEGHLGLALTGLAFIIVLVLVTRMLGRKNTENAG